MALAFTDNSTDRVDYASDTALDDMATGSVAMWLNFSDVSNNFRFFGGKGNEFQWFRRAVDGTRLALSHLTDGSPMSVDIGTGNVHTGWNFIAYAWDFTNSIAAYWGDLATVVTDQSFNANVGSGSYSSDAADNLTIGAAGVSTTLSAPMDVAWFCMWDRELGLAELQTLQYQPRPTNGCLVYSDLGLWWGTGTQRDLSGNGFDGTPTGIALADHVPLSAYALPWVMPAVAPAANTYTNNLLADLAFCRGRFPGGVGRLPLPGTL